jgi:putative Holliday junction resolvase
MPGTHDATHMMHSACVLGFDVGSRRIGVAVGSAISGGARELAVVDVRDGAVDWARVAELLKEWQPGCLLVGDPLTLEGGDQPARQRALRFAREAGRRFGLPVKLVDERRSSLEAARRFAQARAAGTRRRRDADTLDALAAVVIVERWLAAPEHCAALESL